MSFEPSPRGVDLRRRVTEFLDAVVIPAEPVYEEQMADSGDPHFHPPVLEELKADARDRGLWNLFMPHATPWTPDPVPNLDYAYLAELAGRSHLASESMNCSAPDTGNMEVLALFGTDEQKDRWLVPLLEGRIRSAFAMTEPDVASSDATNIQLSIRRDGDDYVLNGRKWWISGAASERCEVFIVMGKTDPEAARHQQQSMILVPRGTPGLTIVRNLPVFGYTTARATASCCSRTSGCRRPTSSPRRAWASPSPRPDSGRAASTTACDASAWPSGPSSSCAAGCSVARPSASPLPRRVSSASGSPTHGSRSSRPVS